MTSRAARVTSMSADATWPATPAKTPPPCSIAVRRSSADRPAVAMRTLLALLAFTGIAAAQSDLPSFEVASIKLATPGPGGGYRRVGIDGGPDSTDPTRM